MKPTWLIIFLKEFREARRDKRTLAMLAMFVIIYPIILGVALHKSIQRSTEPEREGIEVVAIGLEQAPTLAAQLKQKNVNVQNHAAMKDEEIEELLHGGKVVAVMRLDPKYAETYESMRPARVELWFDSATEASRKVDEIEDVLRDYRTNVMGARLLAHGVSPIMLAPVMVQKYDTGSSASRSALIIGGMLGMFFFPAFAFCVSTAVDTTAGERERRSLEVLIAQPATPLALISGKWLAVASMSLIGMTLELIFMHSILKWLPLEEIGMSWRVSNLDMTIVLVIAIPLCLFAAGFMIALAMNAKTFKEAQTTAGFAVMVPMLPAMIVPMMNLKTGAWMYAVPMLSNITLMRELSKGAELGFAPYAMTFFSSAIAALLCLAFAVLRLKSEKYVTTV